MRIYKVFTLLGLFISIFYNCSLPADDEEDSEGEDTALKIPTCKFFKKSVS